MTGGSGRDRSDSEEATTDPLSEVVRALADPGFHPDHPAIVEHGKLVGLVSETDCLRHLARLLDIAEEKAGLPELQQ